MRELVELTLDGIAHGGEALGRHEGKVIFVPYAIPGEQVRAEIVEERERWARARLVDVLLPSADRLTPPCPYFGPDGCGGCQWQHIAYERQAELKQAIVADQLRRLGRLAEPPVADTLVLADPFASESGPPEGRVSAPPLLSFGYRNHAQFTLTPTGQLGFRCAGRHDVIAVERCLLLHERLDELHAALDISWPALTGLNLRAGINTGQALIILKSAQEEQPELELDLPAACVLITPRQIRGLIGDPWIVEKVGGIPYRVSATSFFQVNTVGAEALVELVRAYLEPQAGDVLLDTYCGVGLFGLALAESVAEVIGIESSPSACEDCAVNIGSRDNVTLHEGEVEEVLPALLAQGQHVDLAVVDPPRAGLGLEVIQGLAALRPRRVVYVSCDPATLARDATHLTAAGYHLLEVQPVDMFPQTYHVETVALWERLHRAP